MCQVNIILLLENISEWLFVHRKIKSPTVKEILNDGDEDGDKNSGDRDTAGVPMQLSTTNSDSSAKLPLKQS